MRDERSAGQRALDRRLAEHLEWARWAVGRWSAFPIDADPRPLVMVGERVLIERGFTSGEAKLAFMERRIEWSAAVPEAVRDQLTRDAEAHGPLSTGAPLLITAGGRDEAVFVTDRGPKRLPAWRLEAVAALGPIWILDPDVTDWRPSQDAGRARPNLPRPRQDPGARIDVSADDRTVTLYWLGAAPEHERYPEAEAVESGRAVALVARGEDTGSTGARRAIGDIHRVPARLRQPLGARVFVDLHGNAGQAIRPGEEIRCARRPL